LLYARLTGNQEQVELAIRQLDWATYMVAEDGKNNYPRDEVWLTDGYGDYVRHYLRAMAALPDLAPEDQNHLLESSSIVQQIDYRPDFNKRLSLSIPTDELDRVAIFYRTCDGQSTERFRMTRKPSTVWCAGKEMPENNPVANQTWKWEPLESGGVLTVTHSENPVRIDL